MILAGGGLKILGAVVKNLSFLVFLFAFSSILFQTNAQMILRGSGLKILVSVIKNVPVLSNYSHF
jgi:hypothetical protein